MDGHRWYSKYVADLAATSAKQLENVPWFSVGEFPATGRLVIADSETAAIFLAAITLAISLSVTLFVTRIPRALAILHCFVISSSRESPTESLVEDKPAVTPGSWHLPVVLAICGMFLSDGLGACFASVHHLKYKEVLRGVFYLAFGLFCFAAAVLGPLAALLVSRLTIYGFAGAHSGPCIGQYNFSVGANNYVPQGLDHHMRSYELLPWAASFNYSWTEENTVYSSTTPVKESTSEVVYELLDGCLLNDTVLCDARFPRTHKVSVELPPSRMGLWYNDSWMLRLDGYCLRLNSTSISRRTTSKPRFPSYNFGLDLAPGSRRLKDIITECPSTQQTGPGSWYLGQGDYQRFDRRKNVITDSFFVNNDTERGYPCYEWRDSLRALDADAMTVITVLPPREKINQLAGDELYLPPVTDAKFNNTPAQTSATWANRSALINEHGLPKGLNPLLHFANTEFIVKPARFLRGSSSPLQSVAETPRWEFNAANAPPVPFGAEVHRWAHIGAMDIASKATRAATGFYGRGYAEAMLERIEAHGGVSEELQDLCDAVRATREGTVTLPIGVLVALLALLCIALAWWALERIGVALAGWGIMGPGGFIRAFLMLPATTPVSLAVSTEMALLAAKGWGNEPEEQVVGTATGQPSIRSIGRHVSGPSLSPGRDGKWILGWGFSKFDAVDKDKIMIQ